MTPENDRITPEKAMELLGIKKSQYYARVKKLDLKLKRDNGKAYLDEKQIAELRSYREPENAIATIDNQVEISLDNLPNQEEISEENKRDVLREAQELCAQQLAMPDLVKLYLAAGMTFEDLPPDLQKTVVAAGEAASFNPKKSAQAIAQNMLKELRSQ